MDLFTSIEMSKWVPLSVTCAFSKKACESHLRIKKKTNKPTKRLTRTVLVYPQMNTNFEVILEVYCTNQENQVM